MAEEGKPKDGRARTSAANGVAGGRPENTREYRNAKRDAALESLTRGCRAAAFLEALQYGKVINRDGNEAIDPLTGHPYHVPVEIRERAAGRLHSKLPDVLSVDLDDDIIPKLVEAARVRKNGEMVDADTTGVPGPESVR